LNFSFQVFLEDDLHDQELYAMREFYDEMGCVIGKPIHFKAQKESEGLTFYFVQVLNCV